MGFVPFALSVHHFISSVGADAGFASIIGLAILILLYFAQARETASLRGHAHESADRIQDLEARLAQLARSQESRAASGAAAAATRAVAVAGARAGPIAASRGPGQPATLAGAPVAPAGVAAPPLSAATKLIPTPGPAAAAGAVALVPGQPGSGSRGGAPAPAPATVAGSAAVGDATGPPAGSNGSSHPPARGSRLVSAPAAQTPPPRIQIRPGGPGGTLLPGRRMPPPSGGRPPDQPGGSRRLLVLVLGAIALVVVVAVLLLVTGGTGGSTSTTTTTRTTGAANRRHTAKAAINPGSVAVTVLNGTSTPGLAHTIAQKLASLGYKQAGIPQTATIQTHTTTTVAYLPGFRPDALSVAQSLKLSKAGVAAVDSGAQAVACPPPGACTANVIVTVGSDLVSGQ